MENLVPLGTGNSRLMKSNIPASTTLAQLIQMWNNGTFPYDIGPLNSAGISQQGTPLNKDTLLKDATAALYGLTNTAVPDDALNLLSRFQNGLGNEYLWLAYKETWELSEVTVPLIGPVPPNDLITYYDSVNFDSASGTISGVGSHTFMPTSYSDSAWNQIVGKYCTFSYIENGYPVGTYFKIDTRKSNSDSQFSGKALVPARTFREKKFVNSANQDAYPPATPDGYTYTSLSQLGNKAQIATGSYVGAGTWGQSNPNTLTFDFKPSLVIIAPSNIGSAAQTSGIYIWGNALMPTLVDRRGVNNNIVNVDGNTMTWYAAGNLNDDQVQFNARRPYRYLAIGTGWGG